MNTEVLRIIEGGLSNDRRKILSYSARLADRALKEGNEALSKCIRQIINSNEAHNQVVSDAMKVIPIDTDSRLQIVEVHPFDEDRHNVVLDHMVEKQINEFINIIKHRSELEFAGVDIKKTLLLHGKPGCGKTSIAHYISEQTGLPLVVARLDGIVSSLLGSTSKNIRKIFEYAQSMPCILFLDEFDAIAKARDDQHELGELKRVINSLLQNIDSMGMDSILIAATNHPELLDKAVWRRFVQTVEVGLPSKESISEMIELFSKPFDCELNHDQQKKNVFIDSISALSPSDIKTIFDRTKVKTVIEGNKEITIDKLLTAVYEITSNDKNEEAYVKFLSEHGMSQTAINQHTGISLRRVKAYLSVSK